MATRKNSSAEDFFAIFTTDELANVAAALEDDRVRSYYGAAARGMVLGSLAIRREIDRRAEETARAAQGEDA